MVYDTAVPKQRVNMTLNEDLVRRTRGLTLNLSKTVECLLATFLADAETGNCELQRQIEAHVAASDAFVPKYGSLANKFGTL